MAIPAFEVVFSVRKHAFNQKRRKIPPFMMVCPNRHPLSEPLPPARKEPGTAHPLEQSDDAVDHETKKAHAQNGVEHGEHVPMPQASMMR